MKKVLSVATKFLSSSISGGVQRVLSFSWYLVDFGWGVSVLTMHPMAHGSFVSSQQLQDIPKCINVKYSLAFNSALHFSIKGRYFDWVALPDR